MKVYILNYKRSPICSFLSKFKDVSINNLSNQCLDKLFENFDKNWSKYRKTDWIRQ